MNFNQVNNNKGNVNSVFPVGSEWLTLFKRCEITDNQCGTDTWMVGGGCECKNCQEWARKNLQVGRIVDDRKCQ